MKKVQHFLLLILTVCCLITLAGCKQSLSSTFSSEGLLAEMVVQPVVGDIMTAEIQTFRVYNDGKTEKLTAAGISDSEPAVAQSSEVLKEEIATLQKAILAASFFELPKDVSSESMDGSMDSITIYAKDKSYTVTGMNSENTRFNAVKDAIYTLFNPK